jgi:hypothetical protein
VAVMVVMERLPPQWFVSSAATNVPVHSPCVNRAQQKTTPSY